MTRTMTWHSHATLSGNLRGFHQMGLRGNSVAPPAGSRAEPQLLKDFGGIRVPKFSDVFIETTVNSHKVTDGLLWISRVRPSAAPHPSPPPKKKLLAYYHFICAPHWKHTKTVWSRSFIVPILKLFESGPNERKPSMEKPKSGNIRKLFFA